MKTVIWFMGFCCCVGVLPAQTCVNVATGFDQDGATALIPGTEDDDYTVDLADGSLGAPPAVVVEEDGFPIPPWFANNDRSRWIGFLDVDSNSVPGTYFYEIRFFLPPEMDVSKAVLIGRWGTDDAGPGFEINGVPVASPSDGFGSLKKFAENTGLGLFVAGENTLRFQVVNGGVDPNPTGLRVDACVGVPVAVDRPVDLSTGFDETNKLLLGDNQLDDDYRVTGPPGSGITNVFSSCVADDDFPIPPWFLNSVNSRWVGVSAPDSVGPAGEYSYKITIALGAGFGDPRRAVLRGSFAADERVTAVRVNNVATGVTASEPDKLTFFPVDAGQGLFKSGINNVEFIVENDTEGSTGLRVDAEVLLGPPVPVPVNAVLSLDTGFDDSSGATLANGAADDNYVILGPPGSDVGPALAVVVNDNAFPIPPWVGSSDRSKWIAGQADSNAPAGLFTFKIKVTIPPGYDSTQARIIGSWATDDSGHDVIINQTPTGVGNPVGFGVLSAFPPDFGSGLFVEGDNEVQFVVANGGGPTGLRVEAVVGFEEPQPDNLSTAYDIRGVGIVPVGGVDPRYRVTGPPGSGIDAQSVVVLADNTAPGTPWVLNSSESRWVGLGVPGAAGPAGDYTFSINFPVSYAINPHRLLLQGSWAASSSGVQVILNGNSLGVTAAVPGSLSTLPALAGRGLFVQGDNTLEFVVRNADGGATALRVAASLARVAEANPFDLSTGFDQGTGLALAAGDPDADYTLTDTQFVQELSSVLIGAPIPPWIPNSPTSGWIGSSFGVSLLPGQYVYEIIVDIPTDELAAQASFVGGWATDDQGDDILINGTSTGLQNLGGFGMLTLFPADFGLGLLQKGPNVIQFLVTNGGLLDNPGGLMVDAVLLPTLPGPPPGRRFVRGDGNGDGLINLTDAVFILNYLFSGGPAPPCLDAADVDDTGVDQPTITDPIRVLGWLFLGGAGPPAPAPSATAYLKADCGVDPTPDSLDCATFVPCAP